MARLSPTEREKIVLAHLPAAYRYSRNRAYRTWGLHEDELEQAAAIGLVIASQAFDPDVNVPFGAWANDYVKRSIWEAIAEHLVGSETVPLTRDLPAPGRDVHADRMELEIQDALDALSEGDRVLMCHRYGLEGHQAMGIIGLADLLGCSGRQANRLLSVARDRLRHELKCRGWEKSKTMHALDMELKLA